MHQAYQVRKEHGRAFVTSFDDGLVVPWHLLPLQDYIQYVMDYRRQHMPLAYFEDEMFRKCVMDDTLIRQMKYIKAGVVSVVAGNIWQFSGPTSIDGFNEDLHIARGMINADGVRPLHELVDQICRVYPYKPEEVYAMDYTTFLQRVVQAEKRLMEMGHIKQPIHIETTKGKKTMQDRIAESSTQNARKIYDAKGMWDRQQQEPPAPPPPPPSEEKSGKWWSVSPALEAKKRHGINFEADAAHADGLSLDTDEQLESAEVRKFILDGRLGGARAKMQEDALWIYKDLIEGLAKKVPPK